MASRRIEQMAKLLHSNIVEILLFKSKDNRLKDVTVTKVKVTADLKKVIVFYSLLNTSEENKKELAIALEKARGFMRSEVAKNISLKYTPEITFKFDYNLEYSDRMNNLFKEIAKDKNVNNMVDFSKEGDE